ncbi:hypothetical protein KZO01_06480 [Kurthia zopfii]|uniref:Uncharacterized protein n=1 Tax=Kurthia zopfii TaxID=1650 RepID=A0A8B4Q944_9BACL|nr:hypothetical protein [Kurthia zopfii]PWI23484.1 hypothetical protein DF281_02780 [Kurthia zopfii]TDR35512.1 hypothetical protein DFR61_1307 [Kurthia zopfii]GEK30339.1 hypothetical protein KZO01_06480 [Kurthia zopfii]STX09226.1 Uncharacterised protein [Kurthia zopfii]
MADYIYIEKKYTDDVDKISYFNSLPFDEQVGMGKTEEELRVSGELIDKKLFINHEIKDGYTPVMKHNATDGFYYHYEKVVQVPSQQEQIESLKEQNAQMLLALVNGGLL